MLIIVAFLFNAFVKLISGAVSGAVCSNQLLNVLYDIIKIFPIINFVNIFILN